MGFRNVYKKIQPWLIPVVFILFILELATFPFVVSITDIASDTTPDRLLTFHADKLTWDSGAGIGDNGEAALSLFDAYYEGVQSGNGDDVIAPGTAGRTVLRLANASKEKIRFTVVVYQIKSSDKLPIVTTLEGAGLTTSDEFVLPPNVQEDQLIRCAQGVMNPNDEQDFTIRWNWRFEGDQESDKLDTLLGNAAANGNHEDDVVIGFSLYIHDGNGMIFAGVPMIHEIGLIEVWIVMLSLSAVTLIVLLWLKKREQKRCAE